MKVRVFLLEIENSILAGYLKYLVRNRTAYNEYFRWKQFFKVNQRQRGICGLCQKLNLENFQPKSYDNLKNWWCPDGICQDKEIYNGIHYENMNYMLIGFVCIFCIFIILIRFKKSVSNTYYCQKIWDCVGNFEKKKKLGIYFEVQTSVLQTGP